MSGSSVSAHAAAWQDSHAAAWQLFNTKSLRLQLFEEVHALAAKTRRFTDMLIKFEIGIDNNTKQLESINMIYMW